MTSDQKKRIVIGMVVVTVVAVVAVRFALRYAASTVVTVPGKIVEFDPVARTATFEFIRPKTGEVTRLSGDVPEDCEIQIDGRPAGLADVKVGDAATITARVTEGNRAWPLKVKVRRAMSPGSGPAAAPASSPASQ
ncbi:MAG TPA: hypothetical protein VLM89_14730 [Phycisphaerae bacterium]|nr:hypothetical protein [Phycisphaerae bacterium]